MKTQTIALAAVLLVAGIGLFATEAAARPLPTEDCVVHADEHGAAVGCNNDYFCGGVGVGAYRWYCVR